MNLSEYLIFSRWMTRAVALSLGILCAAHGLSAAPEIPVGSTTNSASSTSASLAGINLEKYRIGPGDKLNFRVVEDQSRMPAILLVSPAGEVEVPYVGRVMVGGSSLGEAGKKLKELLEKDFYFQATVLLALEDLAPRLTGSGGGVSQPGVKAKQIRVMGAVKMQGVQDMPMDEPYTISQAIIKAGGFTSFGDGRKVRITRKNAEGKVEHSYINVDAIIKDGEIDKDVELKPEDLVYVKEKIWTL